MVWLVAVSLFIGMGCSKTVKKESDIDTPENHYLNGMQKLESNDLAAAETEFLRAVELDKKAPHGYTGLAYLELKKSNHKKALKHVKKALKCDDRFVDAFSVKASILSSRKPWSFPAARRMKS